MNPKPTFRHGLSKIENIHHYDSVGENVSNFDKCEEEAFVKNMCEALKVMEEKCGGEFPSKVPSRPQSRNGELEAGTKFQRAIFRTQMAAVLAKPTTAVEAEQKSRTFLGHLINESIQQVIALPLAEFGREETWANWYEGRNDAIQRMYVLALASYKKKLKDAQTTAMDVAVQWAADLEVSKTCEISVEGKTLANGRPCVSELDYGNAVFIHHWGSDDSANNYCRCMKHLHQALFDFRVESITCPFTAMFCFHGQYVSATALPPVTGDSAAHSAEFPSILHKPQNSLTAFMAQQLLFGLFVPFGGRSGLPLSRGQDGRFYLFDIETIVQNHRLKTFPRVVARSDAVFKYNHSREVVKKGGELKYSIDEFQKDMLVPKALKKLVELSKRTRKDGSTLPLMIKEGVVAKCMHYYGVNMVFLFVLYEKLTALQNDSNVKPVFALLKTLLITEMAGRTLKAFAVFDMNKHPISSTRQHIDIVNRLARGLVGKDKDLWGHFLLPAVRRKYGAPSTFDFGAADCHLPSILKIMSIRTGCQFVPEAGRFEKFTPLAGLWPLSFDKPIYMRSDTKPENAYTEAMTDVTEELLMKKESPKYLAFMSRAYVAAVVGGAKDIASVLTTFEKFKQTSTSSANAMEIIRLTPILIELEGVGNEKRGELIKDFEDHTQKLFAHKADDSHVAVTRAARCAELRAERGEEIKYPLVETAYTNFYNLEAVKTLSTPQQIASLATLEQQFASMKPLQVDSTLRIILGVLRKMKQQKNTTKIFMDLATRSVRAAVGWENVESKVTFSDFVVEALDWVRQKRSVRHSTSVLLTYVTGLVALTSLANAVQPRADEITATTGDACRAARKILERTHNLKPKPMVKAAGADIPATVLWRTAATLKKFNQNRPAQLLIEHVQHFNKKVPASFLIERVGRGFILRRKLRKAVASGTISTIHEQDVIALEKRLKRIEERRALKTAIAEGKASSSLADSIRNLNPSIRSGFQSYITSNGGGGGIGGGEKAEGPLFGDGGDDRVGSPLSQSAQSLNRPQTGRIGFGEPSLRGMPNAALAEDLNDDSDNDIDDEVLDLQTQHLGTDNGQAVEEHDTFDANEEADSSPQAPIIAMGQAYRERLEERLHARPQSRGALSVSSASVGLKGSQHGGGSVSSGNALRRRSSIQLPTARIAQVPPAVPPPVDYPTIGDDTLIESKPTPEALHSPKLLDTTTAKMSIPTTARSENEPSSTFLLQGTLEADADFFKYSKLRELLLIGNNNDPATKKAILRAEGKMAVRAKTLDLIYYLAKRQSRERT